MARTLSKEYLRGNSAFCENLKKLYSQPIDVCLERYSSLTEGLSGNIRFFSSPGRAELVGNHTDHNNGLVIACTIDLDVVGAVVPTFDNTVTVNSVGYPSFSVDLNHLEVEPSLYGTSDAMVRGILQGFINKGYKIGGFIANTHSRIFKGAGVSSSAGFELLICEILNVLYNDGKVGVVEKAIISQYAENVYCGKPSGLMDQLTISRGGISYMDFYNPLAPESSGINWSFDDINLVIINCGGDHCNLTGQYADIRTEMSAVAEYFGKKTLREVALEQILTNAGVLADKLGGRAVLRAIHYEKENARVTDAKASLANDNLDGFLDAVNASGLSSYTLLQNCYPVNDKVQRIPLALALIDNCDDVLARRVHGGGFVGTCLAFLPKAKSQKFVDAMQKVFGEENVFPLTIRHFGTIEVKA